MQRTQYTKDFKTMIVELLNEGQSSGKVSTEYGLSASMINRWRREANDTNRPSFTGNGKARLTEHQQEMARLQRELREVTLERDILKKAVGIFSKSDRRGTTL